MAKMYSVLPINLVTCNIKIWGCFVYFLYWPEWILLQLTNQRNIYYNHRNLHRSLISKQICYIKSCIVIESGRYFETQGVRYFNTRSGKDETAEFFSHAVKFIFLITTFWDLRNLTVKRIDTAFLLINKTNLWVYKWYFK